MGSGAHPQYGDTLPHNLLYEYIFRSGTQKFLISLCKGRVVLGACGVVQFCDSSTEAKRMHV